MGSVNDSTRDLVLDKYGRAIIHMRQQMQDTRFGLIFGAGVSSDLGFPKWSELIKRIAEHPDIAAADLLGVSSKTQTSNSQLLFQRYKSKRYENAIEEDLRFNRIEMKVRAGWQEIVHNALYQDVPEDFDELTKRDKYLWAYLEVMKQTQMTINYNFDDSLQSMLAASRTDDEKQKSRGYTTMWSSNIRLLPRSRVIYHPNGFLPRRLQENASEQLVFLEDSFADQLIDSMTGHYASLSNHLAHTTCLLIGLSLDDPTLRHLLRQNALRYPGHYHYYVAFVEDTAARNYAYECSVRDSNFEVYNLITLFLTREELAALGVLLSMIENDFVHLAEEAGQNNIYRFFLTGPVSVGKTTAVSQFRNLASHGEWLEPLPPHMEKDPNKVPSEESIQEIDNWVATQVGLKNVALMDNKTGLHIIDRCPPDAFAFTPKDKWRDKATLLKAGISPGKAKRELVPGHIILMIGDPDVMAARAIVGHRDTDAEHLKKQQDMLEIVYQKRGKGVTTVDTRDKSIRQVAKEIAKIVHLAPYEEAPMQKWLDQIEEGSIKAD
jgi:hypothetical protein